MRNTYAKGTSIRCRGSFKNVYGQLADPANVSFKVKSPSGDVTTYEYGTDTELFKDEVGVYAADVAGDESGTWFYRFYSTGSAETASEQEFVIARSQF